MDADAPDTLQDPPHPDDPRIQAIVRICPEDQSIHPINARLCEDCGSPLYTYRATALGQSPLTPIPMPEPTLPSSPSQELEARTTIRRLQEEGAELGRVAQEERERVQELEAQLEAARKIIGDDAAEDELRKIIYWCIDSGFSEEMCNEPPEDAHAFTISWLKHLVMNEEFWAGFKERLERMNSGDSSS